MDRLNEIQTRKEAIKSQVENLKDVQEVRNLIQEVKELNAEEQQLKDIQSRNVIAEGLENNDPSIKKSVVKEERKMDTDKLKELRNSAEYINAYAEYVKTGKDEEVRALLTTNAEENGSIAVPDFIYDVVKTAWDKNDIMSLVSKAELKGNIKIQFEISGSDAVIHKEGKEAVAEEELKEGIVTITPENIKKWIAISDEVMDLRGEKFLEYIYRELTYKITKKAADQLISLISKLPAVATSESVSANKVEMAPETVTIAVAVANLSDEATNPVIVMNKLTYADFKKAQYANGYGVDVFEGLNVKINNSLPAYSAAEEKAVYAIVGDFGYGALANFPNGQDVVDFKFDELSRKKEDLVEILGRQYVGLGLVADKAFTLLTKPAASEAVALKSSVKVATTAKTSTAKTDEESTSTK